MENVKIELDDHEDEDHQNYIGSSTSKVMKDDVSTLSEAIRNWAVLALELKKHVNMTSLFKEEIQESDHYDEVDFFGFAPTFQCLPNMPTLISLPHQERLQSIHVQRSPSPASSVTPNSSHSTSRVPSPSISLPSTPHLSPSPSHSPTRPNPPSPSCPSSAFHASVPPPDSSPLFSLRPPSSPPSQPPSPPPSHSCTPDNQRVMVKIEQEDYENIPRKSSNLRRIRGKGNDKDNNVLHKSVIKNEEDQKSGSRSPTSTSKSPKSKKSRNRELAGLCDSLTHYFIPNSLDTSVRTSVVTDDKSKSPKKLIDENIIIDKYNKNMKRKSLPNICISENNKKGKKYRKSLESNELLKKETFKKDVSTPQKGKKNKNGEGYSNEIKKTNISNTSLRHNPSMTSSELLYDLPTLPSEPYTPPHKPSHYPPWPSPFEENIQECLESGSSDETDEEGSDVDIKKRNVEDENFQSIYNDQPPNLIDIHMWGLLDTPYMCNLLQTLNLIPKKKNCHNCGLEMILTKRNLSSVIDGLIWKCAGTSSCNETVGLRTGTIFERSQLSLTIILKMVHLFVSGNSNENIMNETNLKEDDVLEWINFFKETIILHLLNNSEVVGEPGQTVDIGDAPVHNSPALFAYGIQDAQLLCGLGRETGKTFLVTYTKHFVKTEDGGELMISDPPMDSLITQWINPGSTVKTKGTEEYPILQDSLTYYHIDINRAKKPLKTQHRENICQNLPSMSLGYHTNGADLATQTFLDSCKIRKEAPFWNFLRATGVLY